MRFRETANAHERGGHRNVRRFGKLLEFSRRATRDERGGTLPSAQ